MAGQPAVKRVGTAQTLRLAIDGQLDAISQATFDRNRPLVPPERVVVSSPMREREVEMGMKTQTSSGGPTLPLARPS